MVFTNQQTLNHFPFLNDVALVRAIVLQDGMVLAYEASKATTESLFRASMNRLKANEKASLKGLNDTPLKLCANYADRGNITWNHSTFKHVRDGPSMLWAEARSSLACCIVGRNMKVYFRIPSTRHFVGR